MESFIKDITCVVCLEVMSTCEVITCGHSICTHCVTVLFNSTTNVKCPMCRATVTSHVKFLAYTHIVQAALESIEKLTKQVSEGEQTLHTMMARYLEVLDERDQLSETNRQINNITLDLMSCQQESAIIDDNNVIVIDD